MGVFLISALCEGGAFGGQKKVPHPLKLELQMVVLHHEMLGTKEGIIPLGFFVLF